MFVFDVISMFDFRYSVLDVILHAIEALSVLDGHSQEICSNKKLFQLACDMVKLADKVEVYCSYIVQIYGIIGGIIYVIVSSLCYVVVIC